MKPEYYLRYTEERGTRLGSTTYRLCRGQHARQHRKDFRSKVGELRQLALAMAEFQLEPLHPQGGQIVPNCC